jgi:hypothetical protein
MMWRSELEVIVLTRILCDAGSCMSARLKGAAVMGAVGAAIGLTMGAATINGPPFPSMDFRAAIAPVARKGTDGGVGSVRLGRST